MRMVVYPPSLMPARPSGDFITFAILPTGAKVAEDSYISVYRAAPTVFAYKMAAMSFEAIKDKDDVGIAEIVKQYLNIEVDEHGRMLSESDLSWFTLKFSNIGYQHKVFEVAD